MSLVAQVAQSYLLLRTFQDRLAIARQNIKLQEESLRIAQAKFDAGDVITGVAAEEVSGEDVL